jgi:hypothetical protein
VCAIALLCSGAAPASAQQLKGGLFTGLFNGSDKEQPQTLDLRGSIFGSYDDNVLAQTPGTNGSDLTLLDPRFMRPGVGDGFNASVEYGYHRQGTRSEFHITSSGAIQEFASSANPKPLWFPNSSAGVGLSSLLTAKTTLSLNAGAGYSPFFQYVPFLKDTVAEGSPAATDYGFAEQSDHVAFFDVSAGLRSQFTKRSSVSANVTLDDRRLIESGSSNDLSSRGVQFMFVHSLTRKLAFHVGYNLQQVQYSNLSSKPFVLNGLDIGLGYGDGITFKLGRYTTLNLASGASVAKNGDPVSVLKTGKSTALVVTGSATLNRSIGRTWNASTGYNRGTSYIVGFLQPLTLDTANAGVGGQIVPRLNFTAGVGASRGQNVFGSAGGSIVTYNASAKLTTAISRYLGVYVQVSDYRYDIPSGFDLGAIVPKVNRRSASVGLTTFIPLINAKRSNRDPG